ENLCVQALEKGEYLKKRLNQLKRELPLIGDVRGLGLMVGIELVSDESKTPAAADAEAVRNHCLASGVLVGVGGIYGNVVRVQPPLVITHQQLDQAADAIAHALERIQAQYAVSAGS
ncbi:MAG TPA: aminotransferase class III-fold pyridoxal phosphate-dependent enzyme, partial [Terriglobales bacterium]